MMNMKEEKIDMASGTKRDGPLLKQFKRWARSLMKVNPEYVKNPTLLQGYVKGPNWDNPDCEYAHYGEFVRGYGQELYGMMMRLRESPMGTGIEEYRSLLKESGIEESE